MKIDYSKYETKNIHYKFLSDLPKGFDVKEVDDDLNVCDKCLVIVRWFDEMYWKGEECQETNEILDDYESVCDDCYVELANNKDTEEFLNHEINKGVVK